MANTKMLMQELWRKADRMDEDVRIDCKTKGAAIKFRFSLYNAVRAARQGKGKRDAELESAIANCKVGFDPEFPEVVVITKKLTSDITDQIKAYVGMEVLEQAELTPEERAAEDSLRKVKLLVDAPEEAQPAPARSTPYYTR